MESDKDIFAEMLGMRRPAPAPEKRSARKTETKAVDFPSADLQEEMEEAMASELEPLILEKAELEERRSELEAERISLISDRSVLMAEKNALVEEKSALEKEKAALVDEKVGLEEKLAALESDFAALQERLAVIVADNSELEEKLARMGRSLSAARRAAFENRACGKPKTGGAK